MDTLGKTTTNFRFKLGTLYYSDNVRYKWCYSIGGKW